MKKCLFVLAILFCGNLPNFAQKAKIDSILAHLPEIRKNDSIYYSKYSGILIDYYRSVNIDSSDYFINEFIRISKKRKKPAATIYLLTQLAFNANLKGNLFQSIEHNYEALALAEKNEENGSITFIERILGESYYQLKQYDKAKKLLNSALRKANAFKNEYEITACLIDLGNVELELKKYSNAEYYFRQVLKRLENEADPLIKGIAFQNLAVSISKQNRIDESLELFQKSISILQKANQYYQLSNVNIDLSELYFTNKKYGKSIENANRAIRLGTKSNSPDIISKANLWLYKNYKILGKKNIALDYYEKHIQLKDSLNKQDFQKRINSLQFEYENANNKIKIAQQNNEILAKQNENLELQKNRNLIIGGTILAILLASILYWNRIKLRKINESLELKVQERTAEITEANLNLLRKNNEISEALFKGQTIERKRVASELHDNLSSLLSAVKMSMQAIKPTNLNDSEKKILESVKDMTSMAYNEVRNISHNILPEDLEEKGLIETLKNVIKKINISETISINFKSNFSEKLDQKIELNLYSVVLELINNIIKHSNANISEIVINKEANSLFLQITDNGKGFEDAQNHGNGLSNINARIEAMNGMIEIISEKNIGTKIMISVPI